MQRSSARRLSAALVPAFLVLVLAGCAREEAAAPQPSPTPIAELNTAAMQVPRIEFCKLIPSSAVREAVGGKPGPVAAYGNGDEESLPGVGEDVVHEIGCSWTRKDGDTARAWVFARPVSATFARRVVQSARKTPGCRVVPGPAFGRPSTTQQCRDRDGERVRHAGLFGQTWLTCEVASPTGATGDEALRTRTDRWCTEVATALNTAR